MGALSRLSLGLGLTPRGASGPAVVLSATSILESAVSGSTVGVLSVVNHPSGSSGWTFAETADPDNKFAVSGSDLNTNAALDYETATSHSVTITASKVGQDDIVRVFPITVTNVFEAANLSALGFSDSELAQNVPATVDITSATSGSTLSVTSGALPAGTTLNSGARTITGTPTTLGTGSVTIRETLADSANSPRDTVWNWTISEVVLELKVLQEGHSIAATSSPNSYTRQWAAANGGIPYVNAAVAGSTLDDPPRAGAGNYVFFRQSDDLAEVPSIFCLDIGANDWDPDLAVPRYTAAAFVARVYDLIAPFKAYGCKFVASDILSVDGRGAGWDTFRDGVRDLFLADLGAEVDAYVDWHDQPVGQDGAGADTGLFSDGIHPTATGHTQMLIGFNAAMNYVQGITNNPVGMSFDPVTDADPSTDYEETYTVVGLHYGESRPYSVTSGAYVKKNAGSFVLDGTGTVVNGDVLTIRNTSSASDSTQTDVTLTVGTTSATFSVVTAGVGGGPWTPAELGSKLKLWLKPEDLVGTDENEVASWPDSSGNSVVVASHFGAGFRPTYEATGLNGFACAESDADTDYFDLPSGFVASRTASSTFFVAKKNGSAAGGDQCPVRKWGQSEDYYPHPSASFYLSYMASAYFGPLSGPDVSSAWHFGSFHATAGDWRWYHNGTLQSSQSTFTFAPQTGSPILLKEFHGYLSEVIDCDNTLTTLERQKVEGYLAWKYGMEASLPGGHPYESAAPTT